MIDFKPLELGDRDLFLKYLDGYDYRTYEYSFLTLYLWRRMCNIEFGITDGALVIKKYSKGTGAYFMQPIGYAREALKSIVTELDVIRKSTPAFRNLFRDVECPFLDELKDNFGERLVFYEDVNNFDYIYDCSKLISLSGKRYHGKKNHYNHFTSSYKYEVRELKGDDVVRDCLDFAEMWYDNKKDNSDQLRHELESLKDVLPNMALLNAKGMAVYVDGAIAGFTIGERVNSDMAIIHVEKGDPAYNGIYAFINKTFAELFFSGVSLINRQEDLGLEGLRKAKTAYHPVRLEKKYIVDIL